MNMSINTVQSQRTPSWVKNINSSQQQNNEEPKKAEKNKNRTASQETANKSNGGQEELDIKEQQQVQKLRQRDSEVRQHELAHKTTGGQYAGNISYTYQEGPDGRRYAVGGSVSMNISSEPGKPKETIKKAEQVRKAALAPAQPSSQDLKIAAKAARMKMEAKAKLDNPAANNKSLQQQNLDKIYQEENQKTKENISLIA